MEAFKHLLFTNLRISFQFLYLLLHVLIQFLNVTSFPIDFQKNSRSNLSAKSPLSRFYCLIHLFKKHFHSPTNMNIHTQSFADVLQNRRSLNICNIHR